MKKEEILKEAYDLGMTQNDYEISEAFDFVESLEIKNFIEIGSDRGGTFLVWGRISDPNGIKISVDWIGGTFSSENDLRYESFDVDKRNEKMRSIGPNVFILDGDSHSEDISYKVEEILNGEKVDFIFIDGDHSYLGVKLDFYMYKKFVKPGGWIGFHDIKNTDLHVSRGIFVEKFWKEIKGDKVWFEADNNWGGIGFVKV